MELTIDFEIAQPRGMAKRPFVAAWVEDSDRFQVKTIALWYHDMLAAALGADDAVVNADVAGGLAGANSRGGAGHAARALDTVGDVRRSLELNVHPVLAIEALFHRLAALRESTPQVV